MRASSPWLTHSALPPCRHLISDLSLTHASAGWLSKKPQSSNQLLKRRWKARWFRLVEAGGQVPCPTIYYYKDDKASAKLGHKVLHDCTVVKIEEKRYKDGKVRSGVVRALSGSRNLTVPDLPLPAHPPPSPSPHLPLASQYAFDIISPDKPKFCLMATTEEQREQWMSKITSAIESYDAGLREEEEEDPEAASRHRAQTTAFEAKEEAGMTEMEDID